MQMKIPGIKLHSFATTFIFLHTYANQNKVSILLPVPLGDLKINDLCLDVYCTLWTKQSARFIGNYQNLWYPSLYELLNLVYCPGQTSTYTTGFLQICLSLKKWKEKMNVDLYEAITLGRLLAHNDLIPFLKDNSCFFFSSIYFFK